MLISHDTLGPRSFADVMQAAGVSLSDLPIGEWTLGVQGRSTVRRYSYVSPRSGQAVYVLSYTEPVLPHGEHHVVWQFDHDFGEQDAIAALDQFSYYNRRRLG